MKQFVLTLLVLMFSKFGFASAVTISGISSGGFMASQMAVIYSSQFSGVATVAGGVFYCAKNHFQEKLAKYGNSGYFAFEVVPNGVLSTIAMEPLEANPIYQSVGVCMGNPAKTHEGAEGLMNLEFLKPLESESLIEPLSHISKQRVLIFQGQADEIVRPEMAGKLKEFYSRMGVPVGSLKVVLGEGNHNFPTDRTDGIPCNEDKVPYVANCKFDLAGDILQHTLGRKLVRAKINSGHLHVIEQAEAPPSIANYGYLYANDFCLRNPRKCDLHVALHGCKMSDDYDDVFQKIYESKLKVSRILSVQDYEMKMRKRQMGARLFAQNAGYSEYAEAEQNRLMIYFPQTRISTENYPANPKGCWDWYGWTGAEYATKQGVEAAWLMKQIQRVKSQPQELLHKSLLIR